MICVRIPPPNERRWLTFQRWHLPQPTHTSEARRPSVTSRERLQPSTVLPAESQPGGAANPTPCVQRDRALIRWGTPCWMTLATSHVAAECPRHRWSGNQYLRLGPQSQSQDIPNNTSFALEYSLTSLRAGDVQIRNGRVRFQAEARTARTHAP